MQRKFLIKIETPDKVCFEIIEYEVVAEATGKVSGGEEKRLEFLHYSKPLRGTDYEIYRCRGWLLPRTESTGVEKTFLFTNTFRL